jgi:hypothetical protein
LGKKGHKVAKIPEYVGDANEEKNAINKGAGSSDHDEDGEDKVNQNNQKGQGSIDVLNGLIHLGSKKQKTLLPFEKTRSTFVQNIYDLFN